jgi:hypothetical protein
LVSKLVRDEAAPKGVVGFTLLEWVAVCASAGSGGTGIADARPAGFTVACILAKDDAVGA